MKNYLKYICLTFVFAGVTGCSDVLDINDLESYSPDNVWNDQKLSDAYLSNLYSVTFAGWPVNSGMYADETSGIMGKDAIMPNNDVFKSWPYDKIYKINTMLEGMEKGTLDEDVKIRLKGEALFLRAYHYFKALVHHGGIPYITKVQQQGEDDLYVTRNSSAECFDLLIQDLDDAIKCLPTRNEGSDYGHVDGSAALALKAKILLYKASPQFNPKSMYNNQYIDEAYEANKNAYDILVSRGYGLVDDYTNVFETKRHKEAVIAVVYNNPNKLNARNEGECRPLTQGKDATGGDQVIWNLIEAYPMKDGRKIGDSDTYTYDMQAYWENRDPRFDASQVWNGAIYELSGINGRRQYTVYNIANLNDAFCIHTAGYNRTGFYPRKGIMERNSANETISDFDWLEMRFAEVMFNYAEIACAKGLTDVGYEMLKQIRQRAGIDPGADKMYGLQLNMTADEMRTALLDEKRIEFVFEGQRFWDLRRNRLLGQINGTRKYGLLGEYKGEITNEIQQKANNYELLPDDFTYKVQELYTNGEKIMYMPDRYYFFPIKQSSVEQNPNLVQNSDWGGSFNPALE